MRRESSSSALKGYRLRALNAFGSIASKMSASRRSLGNYVTFVKVDGTNRVAFHKHVEEPPHIPAEPE